jgi:hypothetical protein
MIMLKMWSEIDSSMTYQEEKVEKSWKCKIKSLLYNTYNVFLEKSTLYL